MTSAILISLQTKSYSVLADMNQSADVNETKRSKDHIYYSFRLPFLNDVARLKYLYY